MAEVLGPVGFCFGAIGFIISTIPAIAKTTEAYLNCVGHFNNLRLRSAQLEAEYRRWEITWKDFDLGQYEDLVSGVRRDLEKLKDDIDSKILDNLRSETEKAKWKTTRMLLLQRRYNTSKNDEIRRRRTTINRFLDALTDKALRLFPDDNADFHRSLGYAIWKKDIIEGWLTRMKSNIEAMETISHSEWKTQTARHYEAKPDEARVKETICLQSSRATLEILANSLQDKRNICPKAEGWGLYIPAPAKHKDIMNWRHVTRRNLFLRIILGREEAFNRFLLQVVYDQDNEDTYMKWDHVQNAIGKCIDPFTNASLPTSGTAMCISQPADVLRSDSLGELLKGRPELFRRHTRSWRRWRSDRLDLVRGLLNWTILLWDTKWTKGLCSCRLQFEKDPKTPTIVQSVLTVEKYHGCKHEGIDLRNIGIALAEIFLATPILLSVDANTKLQRYQQWVNEQWEPVSRDHIYDQILQNTSSVCLRNAISFCLEEDGPLATEAFQAGFMFGYIDEIYKPVNEWYETEAKHTRRQRQRPIPEGETSRLHEWPDAVLARQAASRVATTFHFDSSKSAPLLQTLNIRSEVSS